MPLGWLADHRLRLAAGLSAYLAVLYALGLVAFTLYPMPDDPVRFCATHHLLPQLDLLKFIQDAQTGLYGVLQLVMNVVFFMPMGFMLCRWAGWRFWVALPFSFGCMPDDPVRVCATHHLLPQLDLLKFIQDAQTRLYGVLQLVMNVVFFMPLGFMLCRWAGWRFWVALPFSFGCSVFIETSQLTGFWGLYPCAYRQFDVDDMLTNTLGAVIGFGVAKLIGLVWPKKQIEAGGVVTRPGFVHACTACCSS